MIRNPCPCLNLLIQLWGINVDIVLFLSILMSRKVDNLQKYFRQRNKIFCVDINISSFSKSEIQYFWQRGN